MVKKLRYVRSALKGMYDEKFQDLKEEFAYKSVMQIPRLKGVVSMVWERL